MWQFQTSHLFAVAALFAGLWTCAPIAGAPDGGRSGSPDLPNVSSPFEPPSRPTSDDLVIVDGLRSARPGDIVPLAGSFGSGLSFDLFTQVGGRREMVNVRPTSVGPTVATLQIPKTFPSGAMLMVWPRSNKKIGQPFAINRAEAWWLGPATTRPGGRVAIYGRNFVAAKGEAPHVVLRSRDGVDRALETRDPDPFHVDALIPNVAPGAYEIRVHNGQGGRLGWSKPLRLVIEHDRPTAEAEIFNVRDFGAIGDGKRDDGPAIARAIKTAKAAAPAELRFPPGVYLSLQPLNAAGGVRWVGAGAEHSVLDFGRSPAAVGADALIECDGCSGTAFENLAIKGDGLVSGERGALIEVKGSDLAFRNVELSSRGGQTLRLQVDGVSIHSSRLRGAGSFLGSSDDVTVENTIFAMTDDGEAALTSWGGEAFRIVGNRIMNDDSGRRDGSGIGRLFVAQSHMGSSRNAYFSRNMTEDFAPRDCREVDCNKGEQILYEMTGNLLRGRPRAASGASVSFDKLDRSAVGMDAVVVAGEGLGQRRRILAVEDNAATLDRKWAVVPDATSIVEVTPVAEQIVIYRNVFEGRPSYDDHDSNSTATLLYGHCYDVTVADNKISKMRHGVMVVGTSALQQGAVSAPFLNLVEDNEIRRVHNGIYVGTMFGLDAEPASAGGLGNVVRRNKITDVNHIGLAFETWESGGGDHYATVFERNLVTSARFGVASGLHLVWSGKDLEPTPQKGTRLIQTILHANRFERTSKMANGQIGFRTDRWQDWKSIDNLWIGYDLKIAP